jgi:hypothetical protein
MRRAPPLLNEWGENKTKNPPEIPGSMAMGQWVSACTDRAPKRRSPERVWIHLVHPLESGPTALRMKGAGGL